MSTIANPTMPVFSYAQAAKGLAPTKDKDDAAEQGSKPASKPESNASQPPSRASRSRPRVDEKEPEQPVKEVPTPSSVNEDAAEKENIPPSRPSQQRSEASVSSMTSPDLIGITSSPKEKEVVQRLDNSESWEKASHTSAAGDKENTCEPDEKVKESEDDWEKVSVPSTTGNNQKDFKPAPPPPVNFWAARAQANEAKMKDIANQRPAATSQSGPPSARLASSNEAPKPRSGHRDTTEKDNMSASRRSNDSARGNDRKDLNSSQTLRSDSHHGSKGNANAMSNVGDASAWPTPENAIVDDRRKSAAHDKAEAETNGSKPHAKKWEKMAFTPTAVFETHLPPAAARRGARSARGMPRPTPDAATAANSDRPDASKTMGPPPLPKHATDQDRGRKQEENRGGRSSSLPTEQRRAPSRESTMTSSRKPSANVNDNAGAVESTPPPETDQSQNQRKSNFSSHTPSRSSSRHEGPGGVAGPMINGDFNPSKVTAEVVADPFTISTNEALTRPTYRPDRGNPTQSSYRGDQAREPRPIRRDWSREKSDAAREKVESWRDREYTGEPSFRRDPRPDRGRGGSYRARGNHSSSYQSSHAYTSPLPQNGFENPKTGASEPRSRQSSQPFPMGTPVPSNRSIPRSLSIPVGSMYPGYYNNAGMTQSLSPLQTDMVNYGYPSQMPMPQNTMSAMPYNDPLNSYAVLSMVMTQIEYYFSIDNLCKDLFLRKNMDSQGFVPLNVIAQFKRIKTLTDETMSMETLRFVCQQVKSVEYVQGENGEDKLRRRTGWEDFVLEKNERFLDARTDGPSMTPRYPQMPMVSPMLSGNPMPFVPQQVRSPPVTAPTMNGGYTPASATAYAPVPALDGQASEQPYQPRSPYPTQDFIRRESATSPLSRGESSQRPPIPFHPTHRTSSGMMNGHRRQVSRGFNEENSFPDDAIASINICMRDPLPEITSEDPSQRPAMNRVLSNESRGSNADVPSVSIPARVSGLRGGAASPEQYVSQVRSSNVN